MLKVFMSFLALCVVLVLSVAVWGTPPPDNEDPTAGSTYVGEKACKKCHIKQHRTWKKMKHAHAWENLPEKYHSGDQKDEETGRQCIGCHTTGFGDTARGGFESAEKSADLVGVQCEACHGPGSKHIEAGQKVINDKRKTFNEGEPKFITRKTTNCTNCHNPHMSFKSKYGEGG